MKNPYQELRDLKKSMKIQTLSFVSVIILSVLAGLVCYKLGYNRHEQEILHRAKKLLNSNKEFYTSGDLEIVVFGDIQQ